MVFKRRDKPPFKQRVREFFYPRKGWRRALEYLGHRIKRLPDSPHRVAMGIACGTFVSFTPFFGFHFFLAAGLAALLRGNIFASLLGTLIGNPLTFPLIAATSLGIGRFILGGGHRETDYGPIARAFGEFFKGIWNTGLSLFGYGPGPFQGFMVFFNDVFAPYLVGGILPGLISATVVYYISLPLIAAYQKRRAAKMKARAERGNAKKTTDGEVQHDG